MKSDIRIYPTPFELAESFSLEIIDIITARTGRGDDITIALSGGTTPELLYSVLRDHFSRSARWEKVHFFWGDERCVPPESSESNYGMAWRTFFSRLNIPSANIHRIRGEDDPFTEAERYADEVAGFTMQREGLPVFDMIILGLGDDGHTASIFPSEEHLLHSGKICEVSTHPVTGQKRITLTGRVINNSGLVVFLVTGAKKAPVVEKILKRLPEAIKYPASRIVPQNGAVVWMLDREAAGNLQDLH